MLKFGVKYIRRQTRGSLQRRFERQTALFPVYPLEQTAVDPMVLEVVKPLGSFGHLSSSKYIKITTIEYQ